MCRGPSIGPAPNAAARRSSRSSVPRALASPPRLLLPQGSSASEPPARDNTRHTVRRSAGRAAISQTLRAMPKASEIDDIFAGRTKSAAPPKAGPSTAKASTPALPSAAGTTLDGAIKKKKKPKSSAAAGVVGSVSEDVGPSAVVAANGSKKKLKRPAEPETVVDPSVPKPVTKRVKVVDDRPKPPPAAGGIGIAKPKPGAKRRVVGADDEQERAFRDSRGKEPRRKTEEGWNIYKEDELGIAGAGGNTPLCPFDCDCCF